MTTEQLLNPSNKYLKELQIKLINFVRIWRKELKTEKAHFTEYHDSTRLFMDSIGKHMESIALTCCNHFFGEADKYVFEASGTGGSGYDLINMKTHKGVEVKSCNLIQNVICSCGRRYNPLINSTCPSCGSSNRIERKDTRFGIDAKETIRQVEKDLFDRFMFITVNSLNSDIEDGEVKLSLLIDTVSLSDNVYYEYIDSKGVNTINLKDIRLEYFRNQLEKGSKAHCNLLPNSYDYYKLCPTRLCDIVISFNYKKTLDLRPIDVNIEVVNKELSIPKLILRKKEVESLDSFIESIKELDAEFFKDYVSDAYTDTSYDSSLFSIALPYRQKCLGKSRGDTTINKDESLVKIVNY